MLSIFTTLSGVIFTYSCHKLRGKQHIYTLLKTVLDEDNLLIQIYLKSQVYNPRTCHLRVSIRWLK